ncbi:Peptidase_C39 like family protein [Allokutzneria albata]|uniref:Peptidase_C39 like family protein n=2 Tax=Allokutzneria albata TaxID=211114 RepID=A0A1G9QW74_ALLAB|nr:Peptidase_C39 like family protein [Allokutzneria albata]
MPNHSIRWLRLALAGLTGTALLTSMTVTPASGSPEPEARPGNSSVDFHEWRSPWAWRAGQLEGVAVVPSGGVVIHRPQGTVDYTDPHTRTTKTYEYARWTSPTYRQKFAATELVASWNASTPAGTWLQVEMRGQTAAGAETKWYVMGRWASGDADIRRTSVPGQGDATGNVDVDTFQAKSGHLLSGYQLRVTLYRLPGSKASPHVRMVGAMTSAIPDRFTVPISPAGGAWGVELPVPRYSQSIHRGKYPEYGGGGEVWCSPTSSTMVLEYWGRRPSEQDMAWIEPGYVDPSVAHAARYNWDYDYKGAGNWPFNTAYASSYGLDGHITRLSSLRELERYILQGIPVITSQSFLASELDGAGYGTSGHIMVVVGFTKDGDVIANDPASPNNPAVRHVYKRAQFETIWQRTKRHLANGSVGGGPGGIAYIIRPPHYPLPR